MKVTVEYFAQAREAAGVVREVIDVAVPCTPQMLITQLAQERGGRLASLLLTGDGRLSSGVLLVVGNRQVPVDELLTLRDGDEVLVMPAVSGG
jgi:molybdopterin converting factor small subunit